MINPVRKKTTPPKPKPTPKPKPPKPSYYVKSVSDNQKYYVKTSDHTTPPEKIPTLVIDQYLDLFTLREQPVSQAFIDRLASDLLSWATNDEKAIKLSQFTRLKGIEYNTFYRWCEKHPLLGRAKVEAMRAIGDRREEAALHGKMNVSMVMNNMPLYDKDWDDLEERRNQRKIQVSKQMGANERYTIVLDNYRDDEQTDTILKLGEPEIK